MDREEFHAKINLINELVYKKDYKSALEHVNSIEWKKVRDMHTLCVAGEVYAANKLYEESKEIFLLAYSRSPVRKNILYRLIEVSIKMDDLDEALKYYQQFLEVAPNDNTQYILKYKIYSAREAPLEEQIEILEEYKEREYTERWSYELAKLYYKAGEEGKCIEICDDIALWFSEGEYVLKSLELKQRLTDLTPRQRLIYEKQLEPKQESVEAPPLEEEQVGGVMEEEGAEEETAGTENGDAANEMAPILDNNGTLQEKISKGIKDIFAGIVKEWEGDEDYLESYPGTPKINIADVIPPQKVEESIKEKEMAQAEKSDKIVQMPVKMEEEPKEAPAEPEEKAEEMMQISTESKEMPEETVQPSIELEEESEEMLRAPIEAEEILEETLQAPVEAEEGLDETLQASIKVEEAPAEPEEELEEKAQASVNTEEKSDKILQTSIKAEEESDGSPQMSAEAENELEKMAQAFMESEKEPDQPLRAPAEEKEESGETLQAPDKEQEPEDLPKFDTSKLPKLDLSDFNLEEVILSAAEKQGIEVPDVESAPSVSLPEKTEEEEETEEIEEAPKVPEEEIELPPAVEKIQPEGEIRPQDEILSEEESLIQFIESKDAEAKEQDVIMPRSQSLDEVETKLFSYFSMIPGMKEQLVAALSDAQLAASDKTSRFGNIIVMGNARTGKTRLTDGLIRTICRELHMPAARIATVEAPQLNGKDIAKVVSKLAGGFLVIQKTNQLDSESVIQLNQAMEFRTDGLTVILEDEKIGMRKFIAKYQKFAKKFTSTINIPVFTNDELVHFAKIYADEMGYVMDTMGVLALYNLIGDNQKEDEPMTIGTVKDMMDAAITKAESSHRKLKRSISKKRFDNDGKVVLYEKDFK